MKKSEKVRKAELFDAKNRGKNYGLHYKKEQKKNKKSAVEWFSNFNAMGATLKKSGAGYIDTWF